MKRFVLAAAAAVMLMAVAPATGAVAQTSGYPPPVNCLNGNTVVNLGTINVGQTLVGRLVPVCPFIPGSTVSMTVNGAGGGTKVAAVDGSVPVNLLALSSTTGQLNDPVTVPIQCGSNSITASGSSASGPTEASAIFAVNCAVAAQAATGRVAFTGANILRWSLGALALIGLGALFVLGSRRRREAR